MRPGLAVIVAAGGTGERFGGTGGKQLALVEERPLLSWTLEALDSPSVALMVVVCHPERVEEFSDAVGARTTTAAPVIFVAGGATRQQSVALGLAAVPDSLDYVAVHDGARPLVSRDLLDQAVDLLGSSGAEGVVTGHPAYDTLKIVDGDRVVETPDRSRFWVAQTPQVFRRDVLARALDSAAVDGYTGTDDSALVERLGGEVVTLLGRRDNVKVTTSEDILFVESVLRMRGEREES